jgi:cbb3-type cytochrome oxidase cytochrome c subunit
MTPAVLIIGGIIVYIASISLMVILPAAMIENKPSDTWRPWTPDEVRGHHYYVANGCSYCHSRYIRVMDRGHGAERIAQAGDYVDQVAPILGTERTGPDLSLEGGQRPDDWHLAHFINPRNTSPISVMPSWKFLGEDTIKKLIIYMQAEGGKFADLRVQRQAYWKKLAVEAYLSGPDKNVEWIHSNVPPPWRSLPNPYPASPESLLRGKRLYQEYCINCHGPVGDGQGPAYVYLNPPPLNFTTVRRHLVQGKYIGGIFYYQVMNGITGTAMPYFKRALESEKIWDLSNYIAVNFVGYTDADIAPTGIDASYEPFWKNPYLIQEDPNWASRRTGANVAK